MNTATNQRKVKEIWKKKIGRVSPEMALIRLQNSEKNKKCCHFIPPVNPMNSQNELTRQTYPLPMYEFLRKSPQKLQPTEKKNGKESLTHNAQDEDSSRGWCFGCF